MLGSKYLCEKHYRQDLSVPILGSTFYSAQPKGREGEGGEGKDALQVGFKRTTHRLSVL